MTLCTRSCRPFSCGQNLPWSEGLSLVSRLPLARVASTRFFTLGPKLLRGTAPFGFEVNSNVYIAEEGFAADIASVHDHGWNTKQIVWRRVLFFNPSEQAGWDRLCPSAGH